jgi:hypothetical protein
MEGDRSHRRLGKRPEGWAFYLAIWLQDPTAGICLPKGVLGAGRCTASATGDLCD